MRGWTALMFVGALVAPTWACGGHSRKDTTTTSGGTDASGTSGGAGNATVTAGTPPTNGGQALVAGSAAGGSISSGGGVPTGGAPSGGARADGLPEPPPGCQSVNHYVDDDLCTLSFDCQAVPLFARCDRATDDSWSCQCQTATGGAPLKELSLQGAEANTACGAMARACFTEPPLAEESCQRVNELYFPDECTLEESCGPAFEIEAGITARGGRRYSVSCRQKDTGFSCSCEPKLVGKSDLGVTAPSSDAACETAIEACKSGLPVSDAPLDCTDRDALPAENDPSTACGVERSCTQTATRASGVSLKSTLYRYGQCSVGAVGSRDLTCSCQDAGFASMYFTANAELEGACQATLDACTGAAALVPDGAPDCRIIDNDAEDRQCEARLTCTRAMKLGEMKLVAQGDARLVCRQQTPGGYWWCSCDSQGSPKIFELGPTAADACIAAAPRCKEEIEIGFGLHPAAPLPPSPI